MADHRGPLRSNVLLESLLKASAELAKKYAVGLHTHCGETEAENEFSIEKFGRRPLEYLFDCGWDYDRTWLAHGIHFLDSELDVMQASGIAWPIARMPICGWVRDMSGARID